MKRARSGTREHYLDGKAYDASYAGRTEDIDFYTRLARRSGGPVLEYGAGTGRITLPLARAGLKVTAVDLSEPMLQRLQKKLAQEPAQVRRRVRVRRADMRSLKLRKTFPLVIATFNTFLHLYELEDVECFLACVHRHLQPRGRFVFDLYLPRMSELAGEVDGFEYDRLRQVLLTWMEAGPADATDPDANRVPLAHRQFFPRELEALLHYNGFGHIRFSADFTSAAPDEDTDSLVVSCRPIRRRQAAS